MRARARFPWTYTRIEVLTTIKQFDMLFFCVILPVGMYLLFGKMSDFESQSVGYGNVTAYIMTQMACYSAAIAATAMAGSAATDLAGGWGRQLALTAGGMRAYITTKIVSAVIIALTPLLFINAVGALTGARIDTPGRWAAAMALSFLSVLPCAAFGLAVGLWMRTPRAVGVASSCIAAFAFAGNLFMPLSGLMFTIAHYTPLYGANVLGLWPITDGLVNTATGTVEEPAWYSVANLVAWTVLLTLAALAASRRQTSRR